MTHRSIQKHMRGTRRYNPLKGVTVLEVVGGIYGLGVVYNKFLKTPANTWGASLTWPISPFTSKS